MVEREGGPHDCVSDSPVRASRSSVILKRSAAPGSYSRDWEGQERRLGKPTLHHRHVRVVFPNRYAGPVSRHYRSVRRAIPWLVVELMVGGALVLWAAGLAGIATNLLVLVAAVTSVVTVIWQRADTAAQRSQMQLQSENIGRLAALAERTHALQLAQQPHPAIVPLDHLRNEVRGIVDVERQPLVHVDHDAIIAANAGDLRTPPSIDDPFLEYWEQAHRAALLQVEPAFQAELDHYERTLRAWLLAIEDFFSAAYERVEVPFRVANAGGAPLQDAEVVFTLAAGIAPASYPVGLDGPPIPPERGLGVRLGGTGRRYLDVTLPGDAETNALDGPWPTNHNTRSTYRLALLLHGRHVDAARGGDGGPLLVSVSADGDYEIPWGVYAANLHEPAEGSLQLRVRTRGTASDQVSTLEKLISILSSGR